MLSSNFLRAVLFLSPLFLGCQTLITPDVRNKISHVRVGPIAEHDGEKMRHFLENLMQTHASAAQYNLRVTIDNQDQTRVFGESGKSIVKSEKLFVHYTLSRVRDGKVLLQSFKMMRSIRPFSISPYAQTMATESHRDQSLRIASYEIVRHVAETLRNEEENVS